MPGVGRDRTLCRDEYLQRAFTRPHQQPNSTLAARFTPAELA